MIRRPPRSTLFPYTTLFRSQRRIGQRIKRAPGVELLPIHQKAMGRGDEGESPSHDMATVVHLEIGQGREDFRHLLGSHLEGARHAPWCDGIPTGKKPEHFATKGVMVAPK